MTTDLRLLASRLLDAHRQILANPFVIRAVAFTGQEATAIGFYAGGQPIGYLILSNN